LWAALALVYAQLVFLAPAPAPVGGIESGDLMLVRRVNEPPAGRLVLLQRGREAVLVRVKPDGGFDPVGGVKKKAWTSLEWDAAGYVFFRFGGRWGGSVVLGQRLAKEALFLPRNGAKRQKAKLPAGAPKAYNRGH
jgi:hypothetical protein